MADTTTFEEFKEGTWNNEKIGDFATEDDWRHYEDVMADSSKSDASKAATAAAHGLTWTAPSSSSDDNGLTPTFTRTEKPETPARGDDPEYEGPAYQDWRDVDFSPPGMEFREVPDSEKIGNIMAEYYNTKNPLYRQMTEALARKFGTRRGTQFMESAILSIGNMVFQMASADQKLYKDNRELWNKGYFQLRTARLNGAVQEAVAHVAGNYQLTATKINDITNQWKAQLAADVQTYGIDVQADVQTYITDVDKVLRGMDILSKIKDNPQAVSFLYNMLFGDTEIDPEDWAKYWDEKYNDIKDTGDTETGTTGTTGSSQAQFEASIRTRLGNKDCAGAKQLANSLGNWAKEYYNANIPKGSPCSRIIIT